MHGYDGGGVGEGGHYEIETQKGNFSKYSLGRSLFMGKNDYFLSYFHNIKYH